MAFQRAIFLHSQYSHFVSLHNGYFICHITQNRNYSERERRQSHDFVRTVFSHLLASFGVYSFNFCEIIFISFWFEWEKLSRLNRNRSQNWKHFVVCGSHISIHLVEAKTNLGHHFRRTQSLSYYFLCCWSLLKMFPSAVAFHARLALQFSVFVVIRLVLFRVVKTHRKYCTNKWAAVDNGHHLRQSPHLSFRRSYFSWFTTSELWLRFANGICSALKAIRHLSCLNVWDLCKTQASRTWLELISSESRQKMSDFFLLNFVQFSVNLLANYLN